MRTTHTQPSMFAPEELPYDRLSLRLDVHFDGPAQRAETWVTISHPIDGQISCYGPARDVLNGDEAAAIAEIVQDAVRTIMRQLSPF